MIDKHLKMIAPPEVYRQRRARLAADLPRPMVIAAGVPRARNYATNVYPFRAGSSYRYFGGPSVEGAAWVIEPGSDGASGCTLLRPVGGFEDTVWLGETPADEQIAEAAGVPVDALRTPEQLVTILAGRTASGVMPPCPPTKEWAAKLGLESPTPDELRVIIDMRLVKDEHELAAMRRAADVTVEAHRAGIRAAAVGRTEADVAAAYLSVLTARECIPSFTPIVTVHGEVLHCDAYPNPIRDGQLMVIDAGAEESGGYASDVTRTFPVNGTCTPIQRQLIDTVIRANREATRACTPGRRYRDVHNIAARVICEGLVEAGLLRGDPAELAAREAHTLFFVHGVGHLIGLDVHDMEDFGDLAGYASGRSRRTSFGSKYLRLDRDLEPGFTVTIEPGIYFVPAIWRQEALIAAFADAVDRSVVDKLIASSFGGIRIEDTVCVRDASGPEVLTAALPLDPEDLVSE